VKGGRLRIVGLTSRQRISSAPDIPTIAEAVPGFEVINDSSCSREPVRRRDIATWSGTLKKLFAQKDLQDSYLSQGAVVAWSSPAELSAHISRDVEKWKGVAKGAGIRAE